MKPKRKPLSAEQLVELAVAWLAERDRFWDADKPGTPITNLIIWRKKVDEAREAFRNAYNEAQHGK